MTKMIKQFALTLSLCVMSVSLMAQTPMAAKKVEKKVDELMSKLTPDEKYSLLHGIGKGKGEFGDKDSPAFGVKGVQRLGVPDVLMGHGITGTRVGRAGNINSTYMCAPIGMGCTWDVELYRRAGDAIAKEMRALGQDLNLGPTVNIIRNPLGGRSWESLSEDPYLSARFIVPYVQVMQQNGIICGPKHFAANNQDHNRFDINNVMDDRTLREIYLPAFQAAVMEGGALNMMGSYNRLNGEFACENKYLLTDILRGEWGFEGFVLSDFGNGVRTTLGAANAGLNIEMHGERFYGAKMKQAVENGTLSMEVVDNLLREYLMVVYRMGIDSRERYDKSVEVHSKQAIALAREVAQGSAVLLKNTGILPLKSSDYKSVAVLGPLAKRQNVSLKGGSKASPSYYLQGGGSARTYYFPDAVVEPFVAISSEISKVAKVNYAQGSCPPYNYTKNAKADPNNEQEAQMRKQAVQVAKNSDMAILFVGLSGANETEGWDRSHGRLPGCQNELIEAVAAVNKNVVVVMVAGSYVDVSAWKDKVSAIMYVPYCGEQIANGIVDVLYGRVSPSGRLPISWVKNENDYPESSIFRGAGYSKAKVSNEYSEGIYVGYRYFDKENIEVQYPFGYGLSYSKFDYKNIKVAKKGKNYQVSVKVKNTGDMDSKEVVQLYVSDVKSSVDRPKKELKGFVKIDLKRGETKTVTFTLDDSSFAFYDVASKAWVVEPGDFVVSVGENSRSLPLSAKISVK